MKLTSLLPDGSQHPEGRVHLVGPDGNAWCGAVEMGFRRADGAMWTLVHDAEGYGCPNCPKAKAAAERLIAPKLKVREPDKSAILFVCPSDKRVKIHVWRCVENRQDKTYCAHSSHISSRYWKKRDGKMGEVTCRQCLKKLGQLMGHELSQTKRAIRERREGKDWKGMLTRWEAG